VVAALDVSGTVSPDSGSTKVCGSSLVGPEPTRDWPDTRTSGCALVSCIKGCRVDGRTGAVLSEGGRREWITDACLPGAPGFSWSERSLSRPLI
jgi:hypothetical protein